jgi:RimJ/RimL family protein N-acetyltransferase
MSKLELTAYDTTSPQEAQELVELIQRYYPQSPWLPTQDEIMEGQVKYFRVWCQGQQVGLSGYSQKTPTLAETVKTTVFTEFRGKGFGHLISQAIEAECKRVGIKKVMTTIYYFNHAMVNIKLKQGYVIEGYHPDHEAPGFHEYSLGKILK